MIRFACPMCRQELQAHDQDAGGKVGCPKCGQRLQIPPQPAPPRVNKTVLGAPLEPPTRPFPPPDAEPAFQPRPPPPDASPPRGMTRRYIDWCGTRSVIFQSLLLGWTAFVGLAALALILQFATATSKPVTKEEQEAAAIAAFYCGMLCPLAVYLLLAIPLGIAAIATLESGRGPRKVHD